MVNRARLGLWGTCVFLTLHATTALAGLPSPWINQDVGSTGVAGSTSASNGVFTVSGAGADIWGSADAFQFVYQSLSGDGAIVARVVSEQNTNTYAKAGVMLRASTAAGSIDVILDIRPGGGIEFMSRPSTGGATAFIGGSTHTFPTWLKLSRSGTTITASISGDGATWAAVASTSLSMAANIDAGLAVTSHNTSTLNTATFDNVSVTSTTVATTLKPWTNQDVGSTGLAGTASLSNGVFTVAGAGADVWGAADAFQFVYQPLSGDGTIVARVTGEQNTSVYAKAGVMFRETTASGSTDVILDSKPDGSIEFMSRPSTGAATAFIAGSAQAFPAWLKLARTGTTVTASVSADGTTWAIVGTTSVSMAASIDAGLAVTSHNTSALNTATFDNVSLTTPPPLPTAPASPTPVSGVGGIGAGSSLTWTDSGATSFDVYFATTNPPSKIATGLTTMSYTPSSMSAGATYYWQVVAKNTSGSASGPVWSFTTQIPAPGAPASPSPSSGATSTALNSVLAWTAIGATTYDVAFGTTNPPPQVATGLTTPSYAPAGLANGTSYYWRITARNAGGSTAGPVWTFTTIAAAPGAPGSPTPTAGGTGVAVNTALGWSASNATSYDIAFGTTTPPPSAATGLTSATYALPALANGTTYYWQVTAKNAGGATAGPIWSFTTIVAAPGTPSGPSPSSSAANVATNATLTWTSSGATSYAVNFGTTNPPPSAASGLTSASFAPAGLSAATTYYWQIVATNAAGSTTGDVWSFTTASAGGNGRVWNVPAGGDFQAALNNAQPGDTIVLQAGATYSGNFVLPAKAAAATSYITITSSTSAAQLPGASTRMDPSYAPLLAKIQSPNSAPAIATVPYAHHYQLVNLEFLANYQGFGDIVDFGDGSSAQNTLAGVPHDLVADRLYIHGDPTYGQKRGIGLNSASSTVKNSYIASIMANQQDSQAICGWNGPGPFTIDNNYLEGAGENLLFGGADPAIPQLVPSDITITHNYFTKQLAWMGSQWQIKNILELKNAQRVVINGNVLEYNWLAAQAGSSVLFTPRNQDGTAPWTIVQHVQFTNNVVRHVASVFNVLGVDNLNPSQMTNDLVIRNNLLIDVSSATYGGTGRLMLISGGQNITVDHNTVFNDGSSDLYADSTPVPGFAFTNNIMPNNAWAIMGGNASPGNGTVSMYFSTSGLFLDSIIVGAPAWTYPTGNYYPATNDDVGFVDLANGNYRLSTQSSYKNAGTDGLDVGADIDAINAAAGTNY